jgi:predicted metallopeptidase
MGVTYTEAPQVDELITLLVDSIEDHLHLQRIPIAGCFRSKAKTKHGKIVVATAGIVSGRTAWLSRAAYAGGADFYLIEVAQDEWDILDEAQRKAVIDHELLHCAGPDADSGRLGIRGHDVQEFAAIIARHGCWTPDLIPFVQQAKQLELPLQLVAGGKA